MSTRQTLSSGTAGPVTGDDYMDNVAGHIGRLYDAASFPLTAVGGTGNAVTATLDPVLTATLVTGMKFTLTWGAANTTGVTLAINGGPAAPVLDSDGEILTGGAIKANRRSLLEFTGAAFRLIGSGGGAGGGAAPMYQVFTASGTWTKPSGYPDDHQVLVEAWAGGAGGAGGSNYSGGGGGGYARRFLRYGDVPSSVSCTIGAGGVAGTDGGDTSFGALLTAFGGEKGSTSGGRGGANAASGANGGYQGGGSLDSGPATTENGGGGGAKGGGAGIPPAGGRAIYGGGGGGARASGGGSVGGLSAFGGNGGNGGAPGTAGAAPGGGGGNGASGARGEMRIWL